jgi:hypothetical protein
MPSARRRFVLTDVYCQVSEQMGQVAAMSGCRRPSFGVRVPDVVWMPCESGEGFGREDPTPFVPAPCVEVVPDSDRTREMNGGSTAIWKAAPVK